MKSTGRKGLIKSQFCTYVMQQVQDDTVSLDKNLLNLFGANI